MNGNAAPPPAPARSPGRGWPRAAGLFGVVLATSVFEPTVLVALPLLMFLGASGLRSTPAFVTAVLVLLVVLTGGRDGLWYAERAWALMAGGCFLALTIRAPSWRLSSRTLAAVAGAAAAAGAVLALRSGAWQSLDWAVADNVRAGVATAVDALTLVRGEALSPALVAALQQSAEAQIEVFPAMIGLGTMAALAVAWWVHTRLTGGGDQAIGPLRGFRFNDHLVWVLIGGIVLLLLRWGDSLARVGSNAVVFMGALYALRGAAVFTFVSGGLSLAGYVMLAFTLVVAAPVVLGVALLIGIGDTWLDVRRRLSRHTAG